MFERERERDNTCEKLGRLSVLSGRFTGRQSCWEGGFPCGGPDGLEYISSQACIMESTWRLAPQHEVEPGGGKGDSVGRSSHVSRVIWGWGEGNVVCGSAFGALGAPILVNQLARTLLRKGQGPCWASVSFLSYLRPEWVGGSIAKGTADTL